jgi:hypothetical protein
VGAPALFLIGKKLGRSLATTTLQMTKRQRLKRQPATTSPRRFRTNQIPALHFHALLNKEEATEVELMLASS